MKSETQKRGIQENIRRKKQKEFAEERYKFWFDKMQDKNDRAWEMTEAWGGVLSLETYYNIDLIDYNMYKDGCSRADRIVYDRMYKFYK